MRIILITVSQEESFFLVSRLNCMGHFKYPYFGGWWIVIVRSRHWRQNQLVWVTQLCVIGRCAVPGASSRQTGLRNPCHEPLTGFPTPAQRGSAGLRMCRAAVSGQIGLFSFVDPPTLLRINKLSRDSLRTVCAKHPPYITSVNSSERIAIRFVDCLYF